MTRITNAEQVLMLLRSHLQRSEAARGRKTGKARKDPASPTALQRIHSIANTADLTEEDLERVLISAIFTEEFGSAIAGDAKFQAMVDDVLRIVRSDAAGALLLRKALAQLRAAPR